MERERRSGSAGSKKKNRRRKNTRNFSYYYRRALRLLKRRKAEALTASACVLAACCLGLIVWALAQGLSGRDIEAEMETVTDVAGEPIDTTEPLLKDAYPEINNFISSYFTAMQEGDEEALRSMRDNTENTELLRIQENSSHIEAYTNISCYTKPGREEGSYVVFAYYEVKFQGIDPTLPGIAPLYVCRNADGQYYLHDLAQDAEDADYVNETAGQEDVAALYDQVNEEYENRLSQNETLAAFVDGYMHEMMAAVGEALEEQTSAAESEETGGETAGVQGNGASSQAGGDESDPSENASSGSGSTGSSSSSAAVPDSGEFTVSETVNIRKGVSETSDKIAVCYPGDTLEILMKQADGWTRVRFQGQTGYVRSDVLK
ncbi:MAG TPA: SH3 domain-containing protein [Candidatus Eisenbergiella merdipullorum]|uniref:SH3 domain-containing protein n=1 Tax=Candidatus Eisenbergiella merdipullorum TaxID=2838553 RepID=A0A9D2I3B3_9FIRM|nr:SH3 domain-containing protein [Candidatus Eisenbergiella merdipullorum]